MIVVMTVLILGGCTTKDSNDNSGNTEPEIYTPVHSIGTRDDQFWIVYPPENPSSGQPVTHLSWVNESLKNSSLVFVVHRTGCTSCQAQADRVITLGRKYQGQAMFLDLDLSLGGATEQQANSAYLYDPDGPPGYIALTGVFTLVKQNGVLSYGWHSWELNVDETELESWVKDAIYYYDLNNLS
jgi:uncharacterized protein YceK